jgi:hypothetical protein
MPDPKSFVKHALVDGDLLSTYIDKACDQLDAFQAKGGDLGELEAEVKKIPKGLDLEDTTVRVILLHLISEYSGAG